MTDTVVIVGVMVAQIAQVGLLTGIFYRLGNHRGWLRDHARRIEALEKRAA